MTSLVQKLQRQTAETKPYIGDEKGAYYIPFLMLFLVGSTYIGWKNFALFHLGIEILIIIMGMSIAITAINTYKLNRNHQLLILGVGYALLTTVDIGHALQPYLKASIFHHRLLQSLFSVWHFKGMTLILAIGFFHQSLKLKEAAFLYSAVLLLAVGGTVSHTVEGYMEIPLETTGLIRTWNHCFMIGILWVSVMYLRRDKSNYKPRIYTLTLWAFGAFVLSEVCFIFHVYSLGFTNILGYNFKLISLYCIYKAVGSEFLKMPYELLKESNQKLREEIKKKTTMKKHLQKQEVILKKVLNSLEQGIMVTDDQGQMIHYNDRFSSMWDLEDYLAVNKDVEEATHYVTRFIKDPQDFLDNRQKCYDNYRGRQFEVELVGGRVFHSLITPFQMYHIQGWPYSFQDITSMKTNERLLMESQNRYRLLMDTLPDGVILHQDLICLYANAAAAKIFGLEDRKNAVGMDLSTTAPPDQVENAKEDVEKVYEKLQEGGTHIIREYTLIDKQKNTHYVETFSSIYGDRENRILMTILRDNTEQKEAQLLQKEMEGREKRLEEKRKIDQFKIDFFTNISHELKTPINIISAVGHLIKMEIGDYSPKAQKYVNILNQNGRRLIRLINNLIDINKIDSGYFPIEKKNYNVVQVVEDISQSVLPYMEEKEVDFLFDTDIEEKILAIDINAMERILLNLLSNAIKFTPAGGRIQVVVQDLEDAVLISVQDTGIGMKQSLVENIFQRFKQGEDSQATNFGGSGIGLSLVQHLVEMHQGEIQVESEVGQGSEFQVVFPAKLVKTKDGEMEIQNFCVDQAEKNSGMSLTNIEMSDLVM